MIILAVALGLATVTVVPAATDGRCPKTDQADAVFTVYMTPREEGGMDTNDGCSPETGVITFMRVEEILRNAHPTTDVEVRITQGVFYTNPHVWTFYVPGHTISFLPLDYDYGNDDFAGRPIFRNPGENGGPFLPGKWMYAILPGDPRHPLYNGGTMGLRFYYLTVDCYDGGGISIDGDRGAGDRGRDTEDETYDPPLRQPGSNGHNGNTVFGMIFNRIGTECVGNVSNGYAGIVLTNSRNNRIENNHFQRFEDVGPSRVHGLYITHFSSQNRITRNRFFDVSGQGVKIRNQSNDNVISGNTFIQSGWTAYYLDQFCDAACVQALEDAGHTNGVRQCASYGNQFVDNHLVSDHNNGQALEYKLEPPGQQHAGEEGCAIPAGEQRVHVARSILYPPPEEELPSSCPAGEQCCEPSPNDACHLCWLANHPCP
jgi:parallel beta-helix repeat protein